MNNLITIAKEYVAAGNSVFNLEKGTKVPTASFTPFTKCPPSDSQIEQMFGKPAELALVQGYNNVESFDFDIKNFNGKDFYNMWTLGVEARVPGLTKKFVIEQTPSGGWHCTYRCAAVSGARKLTKVKNPKFGLKDEAEYTCAIETRGVGGYIRCFPSTGYKMIQGSYTNIQEITPEERKIMFEVALSLSEYVPEESMAKVVPVNVSADISLPGNHYQQEGDIRPLLEKHGWKHIKTVAKNEHWRRPGKHDDSTAATFDGQVFAVFSSNSHPFDNDGEKGAKGYDKFSVLSLLEFGGNYTKAAAWLYEQGFGVENKKLRAIMYIQKHYDIRHNIILDKFEFRPKGGTWEYLNDRHLSTMMIDLIRNANIDMNIASIDDLVKSPELAPSFDAFKDYFGSLPAWDGKTDYIQQLADTVELTNDADREFFNMSLKKWLVALVGCAINDNVVNQQMLLLTGIQGIYKSTWINKLCPASIENHKAYIINQSVDPRNKDHQLHLSKLIINCEEFESFQRDDIRALKAMITMPHVDIRLAYRRNSTFFPRRASFIASTNDAEMLADNTGARRFLIFDVKKMNSAAVTTELMDKVYAQALYLFDDGFEYWFDQVQNATITKRNEEHRVVTMEEELIDSFYKPSEDETNLKTAAEMMMYIQRSEKCTLNQTKFTNALKKLGFVKKRRDNIRYYLVQQMRFVDQKAGY